MKHISKINDSNIKIGSRIRDKRVQWNMTQQQLADALNITINYLGEIERGRRRLTLPLAENLCELFGITYDYLFLGIERNFPDRIADGTPESLPSARTSLLDIIYSMSDEECIDYLALLRDVRTIVAKSKHSDTATASCDDVSDTDANFSPM